MTTALHNLAGRLRNCRGVLVDSNVLLDIATNDAKWADWSARALAECADCTTLIVNPIVYAEASIGFSAIEALDATLPFASYQRDALPWEAGFLAGKCYLSYRRRGGQRPTPLPDFYIGAHRGHRTAGAADARCCALSDLFSKARNPRSRVTAAQLLSTNGTFLCPSLFTSVPLTPRSTRRKDITPETQSSPSGLDWILRDGAR